MMMDLEVRRIVLDVLTTKLKRIDKMKKPPFKTQQFEVEKVGDEAS